MVSCIQLRNTIFSPRSWHRPQTQTKLPLTPCNSNLVGKMKNRQATLHVFVACNHTHADFLVGPQQKCFQLVANGLPEAWLRKPQSMGAHLYAFCQSILPLPSTMYVHEVAVAPGSQLCVSSQEERHTRKSASVSILCLLEVHQKSTILLESACNVLPAGLTASLAPKWQHSGVSSSAIL